MTGHPFVETWLLHGTLGGGLLLLLVWGLASRCRQPARKQRLGEWGMAAALVFALLSLALTAVATAAFDHQLKPRSPDGAPAGWQAAVVGAANAARLVFPPLLLAGLALAGISDLLKGVSEMTLPRLWPRRLWPRRLWPRRGAGQPPPPPVRRVARPEVGRIVLSSERYLSPQPPKGR